MAQSIECVWQHNGKVDPKHNIESSSSNDNTPSIGLPLP